ncbi:molybdate ABC transporter permease subunit [Methylovulum psychrotolerans]|jgi:molybdate transport system permease protein|uniref:Molybdenum transport system permease n=1 Tax=Methylovulum psychrotolerans TaxID=1704499 RepID=A0A1Z4BXJ7_9GAMM|nr:molybdate ABC transporter permease subunit [Methylovulum psychrotolerans]ASF46026.1 molybdate ABC transporter permease [Methylovulum psychrotolerans]
MLELSEQEIAALLLSLKIAGWSTLLSCPLAIIIGWWLARYEFFGKALVDGLVHLPLVLPPIVPGYLLLLCFGHNGFIGKWLYQSFGISLAFNWKGAVLASMVMALPLIVRSVRLSITAIDRGLENAARTLGASPLRVFFTITLPLAAPGILVGAVLGFSRSLGEFGATITFVGNIEGETRTLPLAIYTATQVPGGDGPAARLVILSVLLALLALVISDLLNRKLYRNAGR